MVNEQDTQTLAVTATVIAVVSRIGTKLQDPVSNGRNAAMEHKVASVLVKRLGKHFVNKDVA